MEKAVLAVEGLSAGYGSIGIIRDVDLQMKTGEVVVLFGSNGAGKTTTLRAISKLIPSTAGEVWVEGRYNPKEPAYALARRGDLHLPERRGLFSSLTVADHFALSRPGERVLSFEEVFEFFPEFERLKDRVAGKLSGGEQRMLALAQAMARGPRVLLIDVLSLGLAPLIVEGLLPRAREFATTTGDAVLLVEQHVG